MQGVVSRLREGRLRRVVFTMPGGHGWALPAYELALLAATELKRAGIADTQLTIVTPEDGPLQIFGRRASEQVAQLLADNGIDVMTGTHPVKYEGGLLSIVPGEDVEADAVVSLPRLEGRRIEGIPYDTTDFVPVDDHMRVPGAPRTYAVGDVTNFPVKQGGIATQQADVAAESIAARARLRGRGQPARPGPARHPLDRHQAALPVRLARRRSRRNLGRQRATALADRQPEQADRPLPDALPRPDRASRQRQRQRRRGAPRSTGPQRAQLSSARFSV